MKILNDGIHKCKKCETYKKYRSVCSSQPELNIPACDFCVTSFCCISPLLPLMPCEKNTILDRLDNEDEYIEYDGIIPFNRKTRYCKHMDISTMMCKVYPIRPIACRIAGNSCLNPTFIEMLKYRAKHGVEL